MKHFLSLVIFLCADLKADFLDNMAKVVVNEKQWGVILKNLEKNIKLAHKEVLSCQKHISKGRSKVTQEQLANLQAQENRLLKNYENIKNRIKDPKITQELINSFKEIAALQKRFSDLKAKIKKNTKTNASIKHNAQAYGDELNSITTSLAVAKAKVKDMLDIV